MRNEIIAMLEDADDYISGEEMSRRLGISRAAVWKHIKRLKEEGYEILSATNKGYRLTEAPDKISAEAIAAGLSTKRLARNIIYMEKTDSTNEEAKRRCGSPDGTLFIAETQSAGRGRLGRHWESQRGAGIWMSLLLKPDLAPEETSRLTLAAGLAVCRAIGGEARIKWPNDVVIGSRKVCGILTELSAEIDRVNYVVCGIGINVNTQSFPEELSDKATSLCIESGKRFSRARLTADVMNELEPIYESFAADGIAPLLGEYRSLCVNIGREQRITRRGAEITGICEGVSPDGGLIVRTADGSVETITSGDVSVKGLYGIGEESSD